MSAGARCGLHGGRQVRTEFESYIVLSCALLNAFEQMQRLKEISWDGGFAFWTWAMIKGKYRYSFNTQGTLEMATEYLSHHIHYWNSC